MASERVVIARVRPQVAERDGFCRIARNRTLGFLGACAGSSQWAHFGSFRRCHTRNMPAVVRHQTAWSVMLCDTHHVAYDRHRFDMEPLTEAGCDGPLRIFTDLHSFEESL